MLPATFGFESVGVLFYESDSENLYWIEGEDLKSKTMIKEQIIRLPYNLGLTGLAIK